MKLEQAGIEITDPSNRAYMLQLLKKIQALQCKAAGKVAVWIHAQRSSGAIFGGFVKEVDISIDVTVMDVFDCQNDGKDKDYDRAFAFYSFYEQEENDKVFNEMKAEIDRLVKDYDKEYQRRLKNYVKRHL